MNRRKGWLKGVLLAALFLSWGFSPPAAQAVPFPVVGPNGYYTPDYFGTTPNWAWSPLLTKFKDPLPQLWDPKNPNPALQPAKSIPLAVPDKQTYPGSDYYEIALREFTEVMHSEMPGGTKIRGYVQVNQGKDQDGTNVVNPAAIRYLGPIIVATKDRPVRIKFINDLPAGVNGKLFVPVDTTLMGAGPGPNATRNMTDDLICAGDTPNVYGATPDVCFTENRSNLHLHGGRSPWISDGTPHQWIIPADDTNPLKEGASVENVPDMWYDSTVVLADGSYGTIAACAGQTVCNAPNATTDPGPGAQTYYYTNQQSARLLFYHDHAWGITRLNVYVGMAAGYVITDAKEQQLVTAGTIPGANAGEMIPLVIQDKTFVNAAGEANPFLPDGVTLNPAHNPDHIMFTDPTWAWGSNPGKPITTNPQTGDLWWPHVYMPAQNPYAGPAANAFNPMGRWVYGPWFWPPTTNIEYPPIENPYFGEAGQPPEIPATPNPSWGAEAFLDTPVVNGQAYPTVTLQPQKYRFRILNASHDRFFNLQLYRAANKNNPTTPGDGAPSFVGAVTDLTEVAMVPAAPGTAGFPDLWPIDGREGGVPDPATRGPALIQIGNEGGFLPKPVVLPNQPINWNVDPTLFTAGLVLQQNAGGGTLQLGPAERADIIVDFSDFAGHTLILYNDAPAPWPALDPHYDYYTGGPDLRAEMGGPLTTLPGKGPNTRTLMQIVVAGVQNTGTATPDHYNAGYFATLKAAIDGADGAFATAQDPIIVGQGDFWRGTAYAGTYDAYDAAYGKQFPITYPNWGISTIYDTSLKFVNLSGETKTIKMKPKAIQDEMGEVFDEYGRMSAKLGLELPFTTALNQTFVVQNFVDPATEIVYPNDIQIWKITHNGVDTHPVHFHLFDVQVLNRVGWDGFIELPDENELGWKETVRVSPLQDTIVALKPIVPQVPFRVPNSVRPLNPAMPLGATVGFTNIDPLTAQAIDPPVSNVLTSFGHEYVWHCHILSHEESDMMRPMILNTDQLVYTVDATNGIQKWELGSWKNINAAVPSVIVADGPRLYANVAGSGLYQWNGSTWSRLNPNVAARMAAADGVLYADFGAGIGLYKYENGAGWTQLNPNPTNRMLASGSVLYADFGTGIGLYKYEVGTGWVMLNPNATARMVVSGSALYTDFGAGIGLYKYETGTGWTQINPNATANMVVGAGSVLYADFGAGIGLYKYSAGSGWTQINPNATARMATSVTAGSALYVDFGAGIGLYKYDVASGWTHINPNATTAMVASGSILYANFGAGIGLYKYEAGEWNKLTGTVPDLLAAGL